MGKTRRILHIIDSLGIGGAEKLLINILNDLPHFENHLIILNNPETLLNKLESEIKFKNLHWKNLLESYAVVKKIKNHIKRNQIDLVHSHLYLSNIFARLATPKHIPLFNSIHSIPSLDIYKNNKIILAIEKLTYKKHHNIIAVSNEVFNDFDKTVGIKGKGIVLNNFIDDRFWGNRPKSHFSFPSLKLVAVGNLRYPKNYPYAVEAFKKMPPEVSLDIYGEGEMREQLQKEIDEHQLPVSLCGSHDNLEKVLPRYDAFLMTSFYEGHPVSLLEAMACGLPVLLSDIPVLREVAGDNALYFSIANPNSLVELASSICSGKFNLAQLSKTGLQRVEKISKKDTYLERLSEIYNSEIDKKEFKNTVAETV